MATETFNRIEIRSFLSSDFDYQRFQVYQVERVV